jgi:predicted secreted Zn-dependent protease
MKISPRLWLPIAILAASATVSHAEWLAVEKIETYAIKGKTGPELYASIGERGPAVRDGKARAIAHTNFKLTWSRKYEPKDGACTLVSARPNLTITYTLPKPAGKLPAPTARNWETFIAGIRAHEKVHGGFITQMVKEIEAATVGMSVAGDPKCVKIRTELTKRLTKIYDTYKQRNRDFEKVEMSNGGNVQRLIIALVNGG